MDAPARSSSFHPPLELPVDTVALAKALIGVELVSERDGEITAGRIVETEAYLPGDPASHTYSGLRPRNAVMFGPPHHAYVYRIYGRYFCFNVTAEEAGRGAGVLVRALEPTAGIARMRARRDCERDDELCRGPGRLALALAIDGSCNGIDLLAGGALRLAPGRPPARIGRSRRIGITQAAERLLRFYERGSPYVSGPKWLSP
jgi:DNA-3-methyladenine glycosylase